MLHSLRRGFILAALVAAFVVSGAAFGQGVYTFATLPGSPSTGDRAWITDGSSGATTYGQPAAGGGSQRHLVAWDGAQWLYVMTQPGAGGVPALPRIDMWADHVGFDPSATDLTSTQVQAALEELAAGSGGAIGRAVLRSAGTTSKGTAHWVPRWRYRPYMQPDLGLSMQTAVESLGLADGRQCGTQDITWIPPAGGRLDTLTLKTVAGGTLTLEPLTGQALTAKDDLCRTVSAASNATCGGGTYFGTCTAEDATCNDVAAVSTPGTYLCLDKSAGAIYETNAMNITGCDTTADPAIVTQANVGSTGIAAGDPCSPFSADGTIDTALGSMYWAQRLLDLRYPEVVHSNLWRGGDGAESGDYVHWITAVDQTYDTSPNTGMGELGYAPNLHLITGTGSQALAGYKAQLTELTGGAWLQTAPAAVSGGIYEFNCTAYVSGTGANPTTSDLTFTLIDDTGAEVLPANVSTMWSKYGGPWEVADLTDPVVTDGWFYALPQTIIGLVHVTTEKTLSLRIHEEGSSAGAANTFINVGHFQLGRADVQSMRWNDQYVIPYGAGGVDGINMLVVGDERAGDVGGLAWAIDILMANDADNYGQYGITEYATAFRPDIASCNEVHEASQVKADAALGDAVGATANGGGAIDAWLQTALASGGYNIVVSYFDAHDFIDDDVAVDHTDPTLDYRQVMRDYQQLVAQYPLDLHLMLGPLPLSSADAAVTLCSDGTTADSANCGAALCTIEKSLMSGAAGEGK